ncbi:uncharacterized protein EAE97_002115 [Botrytis byssoidea]|uniref:Uncharacterized protein n=1 Tax=Botrytis byssoidea TaxID=139641 RepID=A0A9P5IWF1_9HELO|nr:uncharacterized protein EAE97_002115 [Botrytis byssoidea]KAF7952618.1 hypothetical protein EAE97_002115 [Botrytis byssoidea]
MSRKQIIKAAISIAGTAVGIALYQRIVVGASAFPTASLVLSEPAKFDTYVYPSRVAATIFGADATNFDYHLAPTGTAAKEALAAHTTAYASGDESQIFIGFLNVTGAGTIISTQASSPNLLCNELSGDMASYVSLCGSHAIVHKALVSTLDKRS